MDYGTTRPKHTTNESLTALVTNEDIQGQCHATTSSSTPHIQPACTPADLVTFYHAALFRPALSTIQQALKK
jgi:hypothetical protein